MIAGLLTPKFMMTDCCDGGSVVNLSLSHRNHDLWYFEHDRLQDGPADTVFCSSTQATFHSKTASRVTGNLSVDQITLLTALFEAVHRVSLVTRIELRTHNTSDPINFALQYRYEASFNLYYDEDDPTYFARGEAPRRGPDNPVFTTDPESVRRALLEPDATGRSLHLE